MFSIYVHIPYCTSICPYCDFNVYAPKERPEARYVDALLAEMRAAAATPAWTANTVRTLYLGGGTPSLFAPESIRRIVEAARELWPMPPDAEVTLEATPESVSPERLGRHGDAGINRLSLGMQSMDNRHLRTLGRLHTADDNERAFAAARAAGMHNVSVDLIFAVPGQTVAECESDLRRVAGLGPEHISAYGLTFEPRTPFFARRAGGSLTQTDEEGESAMFLLTREVLSAAGYEAYEISNFALTGFQSRHNRGYWDGSSYLGLGAGAHSYAAEGWGRRWSNERLPARYMDSVEARGQARASEEVLSESQARGEWAFLGLRQARGLDASAFARRFGLAFDDCFPRVRLLCGEGLLEPTESGYRLSQRGLLLADSIFAEFF